MPPTLDVYVAFIRGINVGGNNMVSMNALRASFERLGYQDVRTYINSGNVLFRAPAATAAALEREIDAMLERDYGLKGATVVRSHSEMARLVRRIGRTWKQHAEMRRNVVFLRRSIDSRSVVDSLNLKPDIDRVVYCPGTLLWSAPVSGLTRSAMVKLPATRIYQEMTVRNVNTTTKVFELMDAMKRGGR